nr:hypothetical protein [Tanacetum cinerariifolium]
MTTPTVTSSSDSQMHNNIMAVGSRDRPPMLAIGRYLQWRSRFLRYIDTRPNGDALRKCILSGPYKPTTVLVQAVDATDDSLAIPEHTTFETPMNMSPEKKAHFQAEKEAIHLILIGIRDEIYSTIDACQTAQEMWEAIKRLQQATTQTGSSFIPQTLRHSEAIPKKVNELRAERLTMNANPLALVATAQANQDPYYQTSKSHKSYAPSSKPSIPTRSHTTTRENVGSPVVQKSGIQFFNCKEFGHFAKEYRKPKRVKDSAYHKEKMLLCKQAEQGVPLQAEQYNWLADTDEEIDEQELEAHYNYMVKIQEVLTADTSIDSEPVEQELKECKTILAKTSKTLGESISVRDSCLVALQTKKTEFEKYKAFNDRTVDYDKLKLVKEKHDELIKQSLLTKSHYEGLVKKKTKAIKDLKLREEHDIDKMLSMEKN